MEAKNKFSRSPDEIFSFINNLKICYNVSDFRDWLKNHCGIKDDHEIIPGFKFLIDVCFRGLIFSIVYDRSLDLEDDFILYRARFEGIDIHDVPNSCEKIIFIKKIWKFNKYIQESTNWDKITDSLKNMKNLFLFFEAVYEQYVDQPEKLTKKEALNFLSICYTYALLNDTGKGVPKAYLLDTVNELPYSEKEIQRAYFGYAYTLEYLWYVLLGEDGFSKSSLKYLHEAHKEYPEEVRKTSYFHTAILGYDSKQLSLVNNWYSLDKFFEIIRKEIIQPKNEEVNINFGSEPLLIINKNINKDIFGRYVIVDGLEEPSYLSRNDEESIKKKLDYFFLWYHVDVLETHQSLVFNGTSAFESILIGSVEKNKYFEIEENILVLRFKHPTKNVNGYDYSYAILIQAFGNTGLTDYSGWLVFLECATDYSGFGGSLHYSTESIIRKYEEENRIKVKEICIDSNSFKEYLKEKRIPTIVGNIQKEAEIALNEAKGNIAKNIAYSINQQIQEWNIGNQEQMTKQIENLIFSLKSSIPQIPENSIILDKIDEIRDKQDLVDQYGILSIIIQLIPKVHTDEKINNIEEKVNTINQKFDDFMIYLKPGIRQELVISTGLQLGGSGLQQLITIPVQEISCPELKEDIEKIRGQKPINLNSLTPNFARKIKEYMAKKGNMEF
ncbi:MAG: hypothetical protein AB3K77_05805 [Methanosarcinaceae archaeon]